MIVFFSLSFHAILFQYYFINILLFYKVTEKKRKEKKQKRIGTAADGTLRSGSRWRHQGRRSSGVLTGLWVLSQVIAAIFLLQSTLLVYYDL